MNVLKCYPLKKSYYLKHPWTFISQTWYNLRAAHQRITQGFASRDTYDLDNYLLELLPNMIEHLKDKTDCYPGNFNTFEDWQKVLLNDIIIPLKNARESQVVMKNEFALEWASCEEGERKKELWDNFVKRENEIFEWRTSQLKLGLKNLGEQFWGLWS